MEISSEKILLVEDDIELTKILKDLFSEQGWDTEIASSVSEAKETLKNINPDIIISDLMLTGDEKGFALYEHIKQESRYIDLPFVYLTAASGDDLKQSALEQGCEAYLHKPFCPSELTALIRGQIKKYNIKKENREKLLLEDRKRIVQVLSHEFRTPLVSINTGSEIILENRENLKDEQIHSLMSSIWRGGKRLEKLVSDFLVMQQINNGLAASAVSKYKNKNSLDEMVKKAIDNIAEGFIDNKPSIIYDGSKNEVEVEVYEAQIVDAIGRLLENSLKYSHDKRVYIQFLEQDNQTCKLVVRDFGLGVNDLRQLVLNIDDIFNQVDREVTEQQGCGFGLYIVNQFAKLNNVSFSLETPKAGPGVEAVLSFKIADKS